MFVVADNPVGEVAHKANKCVLLKMSATGHSCHSRSRQKSIFVRLHVAKPFEQSGLLKQVRPDVMMRTHNIFAVMRKTSDRDLLSQAFFDDLLACHRGARASQENRALVEDKRKLRSMRV